MNNTNCVAIVVTYNPNVKVAHNLRELSKQISRIIVIDNGSEKKKINGLCEQFSSDKNIEFIFFNENCGIAKALNRGIDLAIKEGYLLAFTFDQDSCITENFINSMLDTYNFLELNSTSNLALISPNFVLSNPEKTIKSECLHKVKSIDSAMTSGNLLNLNILQSRIPLFNEKLFIDYVDHDFCLSLLDTGYKLFESENSYLIHQLGNYSAHKLFGIVIKTTNHNATRRYYMARNRVFIYKKYFKKHSKWVIKDGYCFIKELCKIVLFEKNKRKKLGLTLKGITDGVLNKFGSI